MKLIRRQLLEFRARYDIKSHEKTQPELNVKPEDKSPAETHTGPGAKPLPDSEVRLHREPPDERQDRSLRELEADLVIEFVIRTVVRNIAGTVRRNVKNKVQKVISKTVADFLSRILAGFHDKALLRTVETEVGNNVAELEDDSEPEFGDRFVTDFVVKSVAEAQPTWFAI